MPGEELGEESGEESSEESGEESGEELAAGRRSYRFYLLLTYFSRRICGIGRPAAFSASKQASTMSGLPHR